MTMTAPGLEGLRAPGGALSEDLFAGSANTAASNGIFAWSSVLMSVDPGLGTTCMATTAAAGSKQSLCSSVFYV